MTSKGYQSLPAGILLSAIGGGVDASSLLLHHVFAGLQTGNLVILGANLPNLTTNQILKYSFALAAFVIGITITKFAQLHVNHNVLPRVMLITEIILLLTACFLSKSLYQNSVVGLLSLAGGIQLQEFHLIKNEAFTSLMMMGHIKKALDFTLTKQWDRVVANAATLAGFVIGAVITGFLAANFGNWSLLFPVTILLILLA